MVGRVPQSPFIYCHPRGHVGISRHTHWHHQRHDCFPHQRRDVTNRAKLSTRQHRLHHWRAWLNGFCWLAMARKNAPSGFGFAVSDLYRSCRSPGINGDYRLRRNLAVERLPWRSHSCSAADVAVTRRNVYGNADGIWTTHLCHRRQSGSSTSLRD